jgi:polyferredoxin
VFFKVFQGFLGQGAACGQAGPMEDFSEKGRKMKFLAHAEGSSRHEGSEGSEGSTTTILENGSLRESMPGVPVHLALVSLVLIILFSHLFLLRRREKSGPSFRFNLLRFAFFKKLVKRPFFPLLIQSLSVFLFLLVLAAGFWGRQEAAFNIAPVITWTWWWALLVFLILGLGKTFCSLCPWEALTTLLSSCSLKSRKKSFSFNLSWPRSLRNIYPALVLFILLTWVELGYDLTRDPWMTALMGLVMFLMAFTAAIFFERRGFCRYACLVGRISGLYALFSPLELRPLKKEICRSCSGRECYHGSETAEGCPTSLFPGNLKENSYCTLCSECVRACPEDNLALNLRPPAEDLLRKHRFRMDEAVLAVVLLALTSFHGLTMTPQWWRLNDWCREVLGWGPKASFTVLMALMIAIPLVVFHLAAGLSFHLTKPSALTRRDLFKAFAYPLIPVALFYHLAHNGMHFFMEGQNLLPLLSDPFGWGWDLFGTAGKHYGALLSLRSVWYLQVFLIVVGHVYGVVIADRIGKRLFSGARLKALAPLVAVMILYSSFSIWLITQPMEMRTGM